MPRGGSRTGTPGQSYSNRSDLNGPRALPVTVPPSAQYGQATALANAQKQIPTANGPLPTQPPPTPTAPSGPLTGPTPTGSPLPGTLTPLDAPSERPGEHVMTGVSVGGGAGPEVLPPTSAPDPVLQGLGILQASKTPLPPELASIAKYVQLSQQQQAPR